jgi:excinuclease ABC subunit B
MYADRMTRSMEAAISETNRRRQIQEAYNEAHGIIPQTVQKKVRDLIIATKTHEEKDELFKEKDPESMTKEELEKLIAKLDKEMKKAARELQFERAAELRDTLITLKQHHLAL